jgi:hypothetical protein
MSNAIRQQASSETQRLNNKSVIHDSFGAFPVSVQLNTGTQWNSPGDTKPIGSFEPDPLSFGEWLIVIGSLLLVVGGAGALVVAVLWAMGLAV